MEKHLEYFTFVENNGEIKSYNIFNNLKFRRGLLEIYEDYKKEYMKYLKSAEVVKGEGLMNEELIATFKEAYKENIFKQKLVHELRYCFWGKCEYETIITDWPTMVAKKEVVRLSEELSNNKIIYRTTVDLDIKRKVSVYDYIALNLDIFVDYVWNNIDLVKEFDND